MKKKQTLPPNLLFVILALLISTVVMISLVAYNPTETERMVRDYAEANGIHFREYPKSLIQLLERNPETEEFVLNYPTRQEEAIDMTTIDRTQGVPLLLQWDTRWGYMTYGKDFAANTACAPLCLSMAGWYLTGDAKFAPDQVISFAHENNYYSKGNGSKWTLISEGGTALGLKITELPLVEQKIMGYLRAGGIIIAVVGPGDFTTTGHYIVITGVENGQLRVNDPNSRINSEKLWAYETIAAQTKNLWLIQNP